VIAVLAAQEAAALEPARELTDAPPPQRVALGMLISARLLVLSTRLGSTASATFARMGLGSVEAKVLFCLSDGPQSASHIGKRMGVDRAAICRAAQSLEARGLVAKSDAPAKGLTVTAAGQDLMRQVNIVVSAREERMLASFSPAEQVVLTQYLKRLMINIPELDALAASGVFAPARKP
jgi:DNA-binding MarR family transcriptional regulator